MSDKSSKSSAWITSMVLVVVLGAVGRVGWQAWGQRGEAQWEFCSNVEGRFEPPSAIRGCSGIIDSGREAGENLSIAHFNRAYAHLELSDYSNAITDFDEALNLNPDFTDALYGRGLARIGLGQTAEGEADLETARSRDPSVAAAFAELGPAR